MKIWNVLAAATFALALAPAAGAQLADGVPGDRLVVPLPDVSGLSDEQAQDLTRELAQMNVITSECAEYDVTDPEWQLMTGTTDALSARLGLDPLAYDREYFRPAFSVLDDPQACETMGPQVAVMITRLKEMGGSTEPSTPGLQTPAAEPAEPAATE